MISCRHTPRTVRVVAFALVVLFTGNLAWAAPSPQTQPAQQTQPPPPPQPASGQGTQQSADAPPQTPTPEIVVIKSPGFFEWKFSGALAMLGAATVFNLNTTFDVVRRCPTCEESNPLLQPIIKAGKPTAYAVFGALEGLAMWAAYKSRKRGQWHWWIAPVLVSTLHVIAGMQNRNTLRQLDGK